MPGINININNNLSKNIGDEVSRLFVIFFVARLLSGDLVEPMSVWSASECLMQFNVNFCLVPITQINPSPCG
jgi:hypothetical protein